MNLSPTLPAPLPPTDAFLKSAADAGIVFDPPDLDQIGRYLAILLEANKTHNLTGITDPAQAWMKHIFDALTLMPLIAQLEPAGPEAHADDPAAAARTASRTGPAIVRVVDIGSGGGVPGIPLAITLPGIHFTLVDSTVKKATFLRETCEALGLKNVTVLPDRAERLGQDRIYRETFDIAMARAVGPLSVLAEYLAPLVRMRGLVLAVKGAKAEEELAQALEAMRTVGLVHEQTLPTETGRVVVMSKGMRTPRLYPRADGVPKHKPIGVRPVKPGSANPPSSTGPSTPATAMPAPLAETGSQKPGTQESGTQESGTQESGTQESGTQESPRS